MCGNLNVDQDISRVGKVNEVSARCMSFPFLSLTCRLYFCSRNSIRCRRFGAESNDFRKIGSSGL